MPALDQLTARRQSRLDDRLECGKNPRSETTRPDSRPGARASEAARNSAVLRGREMRAEHERGRRPVRGQTPARTRRQRRPRTPDRPAAPPRGAPATAANRAARAPSPRSPRSADSGRGSRRIQAAERRPGRPRRAASGMTSGPRTHGRTPGSARPRTRALRRRTPPARARAGTDFPEYARAEPGRSSSLLKTTLGEVATGPLSGLWLPIRSCRKGELVSGRIRPSGLVRICRCRAGFGAGRVREQQEQQQ